MFLGLGLVSTLLCSVGVKYSRHIPVAIKVLRQPMDDLDPTLAADFDREVCDLNLVGSSIVA